MLSYQHEAEHVVMHFVALEIIMEFPEYYYESLVEDVLKEQIVAGIHKLKRTKSSKDHTSRSCFNKTFRVIYKLFRAYYVSFVFYFTPFIAILNYFTIYPGDFPAAE